MIKELELFLKALKQVTEKHYVQHLQIEPTLKPAFKKVTLSVHNIDDKSVVSVNKVFKITNNDEKQLACMAIAENLITTMLKMNYEISTP